MERVIKIPTYLNNTIFIGKIGSGEMHEKNLNAHQGFLAPHVWGSCLKENLIERKYSPPFQAP
jgi:hypothetical protein